MTLPVRTGKGAGGRDLLSRRTCPFWCPSSEANRQFLGPRWVSFHWLVFLKAILSIYYVPNTVQSDKDTAVNEAKPLPRGVYIGLENTANEQLVRWRKESGGEGVGIRERLAAVWWSSAETSLTRPLTSGFPHELVDFFWIFHSGIKEGWLVKKQFMGENMVAALTENISNEVITG